MTEWKYLMATKAIHGLGDISRDEPDLCVVNEEHNDYYVGHWVTGFGFMDVKFPKETTRELTKRERKKYNNKGRTLNGIYLGKVKIPL